MYKIFLREAKKKEKKQMENQTSNSSNVTGKDALLLWAQNTCKSYKNVSIKDFDVSWKNGLAFCALIHSYRPSLIDFNSLNPQDASKNLQIAFAAAEQLGISAFISRLFFF